MAVRRRSRLAECRRLLGTKASRRGGAIASIREWVEFAALVAVIPAILNSFYILSSVKKFIERKQISVRPTTLRPDGRLEATDNSEAPTTLARLILLGGPLSEQQIVKRILVLVSFSSALGVATAALTWLI